MKAAFTIGVRISINKSDYDDVTLSFDPIKVELGLDTSTAGPKIEILFGLVKALGVGDISFGGNIIIEYCPDCEEADVTGLEQIGESPLYSEGTFFYDVSADIIIALFILSLSYLTP